MKLLVLTISLALLTTSVLAQGPGGGAGGGDRERPDGGAGGGGQGGGAGERTPPGEGGRGSEDEGMRGGQGESPMGRGPAGRERRVCDLANLPDSVDASVQPVVTGIINGASVATILPHLHQISDLCFAQLVKEHFEGYECSVADASNAMCNADGNLGKIRPFIACWVAKTRPGMENDDDDATSSDENTANKKKFCDAFKGATQQCGESIKLPQQAIEMTVAFCGTEDLSLKDQLKLNPSILKKHFENMDSAKFGEFLTQLAAAESSTGLLTHVGCDQAKVIMLRAEKYLEAMPFPLEAVTNDATFWALAPLIPYMPAKVCEAIPVDTLVAQLSKFKDLSFPCNDKMGNAQKPNQGQGSGQQGPGQQGSGQQGSGQQGSGQGQMMMQQRRQKSCPYMCGKIIIKKLTEEKWDALSDDQKEALSGILSCLKATDRIAMLGPEDCKKSSEVLQDLGAETRGPESERLKSKLANQCKPEGEASSWTTQQLIDMECSILGLKPKEMKDITEDKICLESVICNLMEKCPNIRAEDVRALKRKCADTDMSGFSCYDDVEDLSNTARLQEMDGDKIRGNLKNVKELVATLPRRERSQAAYAISRQLRISEFTDNEEMMKAVKTKDLLKEIVGKAKQFMADNPEAKLSKSQARALAKEIVKEVAGGKAADLTPENIRELREIASRLDRSDIKSLNRDLGLELLKELCTQTAPAPLTGRKAEVAAMLMKASIADVGSDESPLADLSEDEVLNMDGACFLEMTPEELVKLDSRLTQAICTIVGNLPQLPCQLNSNRRNKWANVCLENSNNDGVTDPVDNAGQIVGDVDKSSLGSLTEEQIVKLAKVIIDRRNPVRQELKRAVLSRLRQANPNLEEEGVAESLGPAVCQLEIKNAEQAQAVINSGALDSEVNELTEDEEASMECRFDQLNIEDREAIEQERKACAKARMEMALLAKENEPERKKRSVVTNRVARDAHGDAPVITCDEIVVMTDLSVLTESIIDHMEDNEITLCIANLGEFEAHSKSTAALILQKFIGDQNVCDFDEISLRELGSLVNGLSVAELGCVKNIKDVILGWGSYSFWSKEQLEAIAANYLSKTSLPLSAMEIVNLNHILCGLSKDTIMDIPGDTISATVLEIGKMSSCPSSEALDALAARAMALFDVPVDELDAGNFQELNILLGGMSAEDLNKANQDALSGWQRVGIMHLPPDVAKDLDPEIVRELGMHQASAFTDEQLEVMDVDLRNAIYYAKDGLDGSSATVETTEPVKPTTAGCSGLMSSGILLTVVISTLLSYMV